MVVRLVGRRDVNFKDEKTGQKISGMTVHFLVPIDSHGDGFEGDRFFVPSSKEDLIKFINSFDIDEMINIEYNKYGKVSQVSALD